MIIPTDERPMVIFIFENGEFTVPKISRFSFTAGLEAHMTRSRIRKIVDVLFVPEPVE